MKVLHINSYYSCSSFYKNLYNKQIESGLDINVYVPVPESLSTSNLNLGEYTTISRNHKKYDRILFQRKHRKIYKDIIKTYEINRFSLVHAHSLFSNGYIAYKLREKYNVPYVVAVRNTDVNVFFKYMPHLRKLGISIINKANKIIFLSAAYKDFLVDNYIPSNLKEEIVNKSEVIPNGIDDFWLKNKGVSKTITEQKINLLTVGFVNKNKNQLAVTKAINLLEEKGYKINYTIVGGIKDKKIYRQIKDLPYIRYIPHSSKEGLLDVYRRNDIFVMPSITETFGLVYVEAMSQGLPVIYTRGQGFDGHFKEGEVGYSVKPMCPEEIARRIIKVSNDYSNISERCIKYADKFNWSLINNEYKKIYESIR